MTCPAAKDSIQPDGQSLAIQGTCPSCESEILIVVGTYTSREECLSCGRIGSLAWTSWQTEPVHLSSPARVWGWVLKRPPASVTRGLIWGSSPNGP